MEWHSIETPEGLPPPRPLTVRAQSIPPRHFFPEHAHDWDQVVYAVQGVLTVAAAGQSFVVSPDQAVWIPAGLRHRVGSLIGAEFRSLWIAREAGEALPRRAAVFAVTALLQALIVEAAAVAGTPDEDGYGARVVTLILDQLRRARVLPNVLPWPSATSPLAPLCEALHADPGDPRGSAEWSAEMAMSERTLARRFESELGMSFRSWRRRLRLFKAIELLGSGRNVTQTAMDLGYGSTSAFVYSFRTALGESPQEFRRRSAAIRPAAGPAEEQLQGEVATSPGASACGRAARKSGRVRAAGARDR